MGSAANRRSSVASMSSRRDQIKMTDAEVATFLEQQPILNVATNGPTGHPHLVAMWFVLLDGAPAFWTFGKSQKIVNLQRDPRISALVESGDTYAELRGVEVRGTARIVDDVDTVLRIGVGVAGKYNGPEAVGPKAMPFLEQQATKRVGVIIDVDHVTSWDHTKLGGRY